MYPENWYEVKKETLLKAQVLFMNCSLNPINIIIIQNARKILYFYDTFTQALLDLYPNLPWDKSQLNNLSETSTHIRMLNFTLMILLSLRELGKRIGAAQFLHKLRSRS